MTSCGAQKLIEDVARIAAIGIRPVEDVEALAVVGAQNTHHGVACQLLRGPAVVPELVLRRTEWIKRIK